MTLVAVGPGTGTCSALIHSSTKTPVLSITWFTQTAASSQRLYYETAHSDPGLAAAERIGVPTGVLALPNGLPNERTPRETIERHFNVQRYTIAPSGGHYPALDIPEILTDDVRAYFRALRAGVS